MGQLIGMAPVEPGIRYCCLNWENGIGPDLSKNI
jgi:hypothetical protein